MRFFTATVLFFALLLVNNTVTLAGGNEAAMPTTAPTRLSADEQALHRAPGTNSHINAIRVADELAAEIGLRPGQVRLAVERFISKQLATAPGSVTIGTELSARVALYELIRHDVPGFQRALSAVLPDEAYAQYVSLLDSLNLTAQ